MELVRISCGLVGLVLVAVCIVLSICFMRRMSSQARVAQRPVFSMALAIVAAAHFAVLFSPPVAGLVYGLVARVGG